MVYFVRNVLLLSEKKTKKFKPFKVYIEIQMIDVSFVFQLDMIFSVQYCQQHTKQAVAEEPKPFLISTL